MHLEKITKKQERDLKFKEQEKLEIAVKRRTIAIYHAKAFKFYSDNESNIQKMLESWKKQFREIFEKKFNKHR